MRLSSRTDPDAGFTLVELLVVVGIITVLVAILLPVLAKAREHANRIACAANLRSVGQALTMYTQQFGYYPGCDTNDDIEQAAIWPVRLRGLMGGDKRPFHCPSRDDRYRWTDAGPEPVVRARPLFLTFGYGPGEPLIHTAAYFSYGYNGWGTHGHGNTFAGTHYGLGFYISAVRGPEYLRTFGGELRANRVRVAEDMIAVADSN